MENQEQRRSPFLLAGALALLSAAVLCAFGAAAMGLDVSTPLFKVSFADAPEDGTGLLAGLTNPFGDGFEISFTGSGDTGGGDGGSSGSDDGSTGGGDPGSGGDEGSTAEASCFLGLFCVNSSNSADGPGDTGGQAGAQFDENGAQLNQDNSADLENGEASLADTIVSDAQDLVDGVDTEGDGTLENAANDLLGLGN